MKRLCFFCLATVLVFSLCACSGNGKNGTATVNINQLQQTMLAADPDLKEMTSVTGEASDGETLFAYMSELPYSKVDNFLLSYSTAGKADEVAVIVVKEEKDAEEAAKTLRAHVEQRLRLFRQYSPDQVSRVEKAQVFTKGRYAVLIIADRGKDVRNAFEQAVGL